MTLLVAEYPGNEKVPAAPYKLGMALAETHNLVRSRDSFKELINEFPYSAEAALAKSRFR
jgi:TolA-binding protein